MNPFNKCVKVELINEIYDEISVHTNCDFENGLAGIGWGIEYLAQNGFIEADTDDMLSDFDNTVFQLDKKSPKPVYGYNDFFGPGIYFLSRINELHDNEEILKILDIECLQLLNELYESSIEVSPQFLISFLFFLSEYKDITKTPILNFKCQVSIADLIKNISFNEWNDVQLLYLKKTLERFGVYIDEVKTKLIIELSVNKRLECFGQFKIIDLLFKENVFNLDNENIIEITNYIDYGLRFNSINKYDSPEKIHKNIFGCLLYLVEKYLNEAISIHQRKIESEVYIISKKNRGSEFGVRTYINELTNGFKQVNFPYTVIKLGTDNPFFEIEQADENWIINFPEIKFKGIEVSNSQIYIHNVLRILKLYLANNKTTIFHLNLSNYNNLPSKLRNEFNCKIVYTVHYMDWATSLKGNINKLNKILNKPKIERTDSFEKDLLMIIENEKQLMEECDRVICVAKYQKELINRIYKIQPEKLTVIYNGIGEKKSIDSHEQSKLKLQLQAVENEKIILFAGRLDEIKGILFLIRAFRLVLETEPNCRLWIIGSGNYDTLFAETFDIWHKITFTGKIPQDQLFALYNVADIGVVPSLFEPFGYVAIEMIQCGLPVIATATSGLNETIINGETGIKINIIESNNKMGIDIEQLAKSILLLLNNCDERDRLGRNAKEFYKRNFASAKMCNNTLKCYELIKNESKIQGKRAES